MSCVIQIPPKNVGYLYFFSYPKQSVLLC